MLALIIDVAVWMLLSPQSTGPTWNGLTVGISTKHDVIAKLGTPSSIDEHGDTVILHYEKLGEFFASPLQTVTLRDGLIDLIDDEVINYHTTYLTQLLQNYGMPDYVLWSAETPFWRAAIYPQQGILIITSGDIPIKESEVIQVEYFRPCSLSCIITKFNDKVSLYNPDIGGDIVPGPKDPWGIAINIFP